MLSTKGLVFDPEPITSSLLAKHFLSQSCVTSADPPDLERTFESSLFSNPDIFGRIQADVQKAAELKHPAIVPFTGAKIEGRFLTIQRPFVEGENFSEILFKSTTESIDVCFKYASMIADALCYLHAHHVLACSLKPENVILKSDGTIAIVDIGVHAIYTDATEKPKDPMSYAAFGPEGITNNSRVPTMTLDIYHFGILMYAIFHGKYPWTRPNLPHVLRDMTNGRIECDSAVPKGVATLIHSMLCPEPDRRPSAREVAIRLTTLRESLKGDREPLVFGARKFESASMNLTFALQTMKPLSRHGIQARSSMLKIPHQVYIEGDLVVPGGDYVKRTLTFNLGSGKVGTTLLLGTKPLDKPTLHSPTGHAE